MWSDNVRKRWGQKNNSQKQQLHVHHYLFVGVCVCVCADSSLAHFYLNSRPPKLFHLNSCALELIKPKQVQYTSSMEIMFKYLNGCIIYFLSSFTILLNMVLKFFKSDRRGRSSTSSTLNHTKNGFYMNKTWIAVKQITVIRYIWSFGAVCGK